VLCQFWHDFRSGKKNRVTVEPGQPDFLKKIGLSRLNPILNRIFGIESAQHKFDEKTIRLSRHNPNCVKNQKNQIKKVHAFVEKAKDQIETANFFGLSRLDLDHIFLSKLGCLNLID